MTVCFFCLASTFQTLLLVYRWRLEGVDDDDLNEGDGRTDGRQIDNQFSTDFAIKDDDYDCQLKMGSSLFLHDESAERERGSI